VIAASSSLSWTLGTWYHIAVTRSGNTYTLWRDGVSVGTGTNTNALDSAAGYRIGNSINGYFSNFRLVKGTALYTSNFTPATAPLPAVPNTSLLLNTDNYTIANSTPTYLPVTVNGNTTISTAQYPTGMNRSIYFDGSGDYLSLARNNIFLPGANVDFSFECYVYINSITSNAMIMGLREAGLAQDWVIFIKSSDRSVRFEIGPTPSFSLDSTQTIPLTTWTHIAISRSGTGTNNLGLFVNGIGIFGTTNISLVNTGNYNFSIGADQNGDEENFNGYISNLRIVNGSGLYTANFTPPAAPLPLSVTVPAFVTNNIYGVYQLA